MIRVAPQLRGYSQQQLLRFLKDGRAILQGETIVPTVSGGVAPPLRNNAESGTDTATVTTGNSGGTNANAFNGVTIGASATLTYDSVHAAHGTLGFKTVIGATNQPTHMIWTGLGGVTEMWGAFYIYITANPTSTIRLIAFFSGGALLGNLGFPNSNGHIQWKFPGDTSVGTTNVSSAATLNGWTRVEFHVVFNTTTGSGEAKVFSGDSTSQGGGDETFSAANTGASCDEVRIGMNAASTTVSYTYWLDSLNFNTVGFPGPGPYLANEFARPDADVTDGGWTNELGTNVNLYQSLDEAVASDADLIESSDSPATPDVAEINLSNITP